MKVAIVYPIPFGPDGLIGGGERYALEFAKAMSGAAETVLVTVGPARKMERLGSLRLETHPWLALVRGLRQNPLSFGFVRSLVGADIIHCLSYSTLLTDLSVLFARLTGKKVFITDVGGGGNFTLARWVDVAGLSNGLLLLSRFASSFFARTVCRREVIYGGVDTDRFSPGESRRSQKIVYVGRLLAHKGVNYLVEAVDARTPLVVAGPICDRAYFEYLTRLAAGKNVLFKTTATDDDIIAEYRTCAAAVLPSVYRDIYGNQADAPELLGLTILEAMACGAPVICTKVGSLPELVNDGMTGFGVPPNDSQALRERVVALLNEPARASQMGAQARASVLERFTWSKVVDRCLAIYNGGRFPCEVTPAVLDATQEAAAPQASLGFRAIGRAAFVRWMVEPSLDKNPSLKSPAEDSDDLRAAVTVRNESGEKR